MLLFLFDIKLEHRLLSADIGWCTGKSAYDLTEDNAILLGWLLSRYESVAWIPNVVAFMAMLGVGAKHLVLLPAPAPVSAAAVLSYSSTVASSVLSWSTMTADYGVYHSGKASAYVSLTMLVPLVTFLTVSEYSHILIWLS